MILSLALGSVVGIILALTGAGGGILAVPLLVFGVHLGVAEAGPIGLMAVGLSAALGAVMGLRQGIVRYRAAVVLAGSGILVSPLGLWLAHRLPNRPLALLFGAVLLLVAYRAYTHANSRAKSRAGGADVARQDGGHMRAVPCQTDPESGRFIWTLPCAGVFLGAGALTGLLSGLLGVGGGFVMVPVLRRYTNLPIHSIVATSLAVIALVAASGVAASALAGHVAWEVGLPFSAGAALGMLGGGLIAPHLGVALVNRAFALVAASVALGMIGKALL